MSKKASVQQYIDFTFNSLKMSIERQKVRIDKMEEHVADKESSGYPSVAHADLPYSADGMNSFAVRFVSDGRKSGEGVGTGTGVPCWYDSASNTWLKISDDVAVTV